MEGVSLPDCPMAPGPRAGLHRGRRRASCPFVGMGYDNCVPGHAWSGSPCSSGPPPGAGLRHDRLVLPMTPDLLAGGVVVASVGGWAIFTAYLRARPEAAPPVESSLRLRPTGAPVATSGMAERTPKPRSSAADVAGVTRRQFLNRAYVAAVLVGLSNFALASLDYLWPRNAGGLGGKVNLGDADQLRARLEARVPITHAETELLPPGIYLMTYEGEPDAANKTPHTSPPIRPHQASARSIANASTSGAPFRSAPPRSGSSAPATARSTRSTVNTARAPPPAASIATGWIS